MAVSRGPWERKVQEGKDTRVNAINQPISQSIKRTAEALRRQIGL